MSAIPKISNNHLEALCAVIGDTSEGLTGGQIGALLDRCGIGDPTPDFTKRVRLFNALRVKQETDGAANTVLNFVQTVLDPVRFRGNPHGFEEFRARVNEVLAFAGYHAGDDGKLRKVTQAATISEAQERAGRLRAELVRRRVHPEVLRYCREDLLRKDYFDTVFEATKGVAERIRQLTGLTLDGAALVDAALSVDVPRLAINTLRTETERSEQKGFSNILKGIFGLFRNPEAHAPKVIYPVGEEDAFDLLSLVSYVHRRLDRAAVVPRT